MMHQDQQSADELKIMSRNLRLLRERRGKSLEEVAAETRISPLLLASVEQGCLDNLGMAQLQELCRYYRVGLSGIFQPIC